MPARKFVAGNESRELIDEAIERHLPITLTNRHGDVWQVYKSHFVRRHANLLTIALPTPDVADCHMEPAIGQEVAVTFKKGYNKCLFVTRIVRQETIELEPGIFMPAISLFMPQQIEKIQRRAFNRAMVPATLDVPVTLRAQNPQATPSSFTGRLHDLSAGGAGVLVSKETAAQLKENQPFLMAFTPLADQDPIQLPTRMRHIVPEESSDQHMAGFQLMGLELTEEGRHLLRRLGRIVSVYERQNQFSETH